MKKYGLIGKKLSHSFSKDYFSKKFMDLGLTDYSYDLFPLENISQIVDLIKANPELQGFNITIPYKEEIIPYLDSMEENAKEIGAFNVVKIKNNKLTGYNSDFFGFKSSLENWYKPTKNNKALVLGTGGASKAVAAALGALNIEFKYVSRDNQKASLTYNNFVDSPELILEYPLIINTTPLGMAPNTESMPELPYAHLTSDHFLYDLVYNPTETKFLSLGKAQNCQVKNGLEMLHLQAEKSWEIWNS
ncbi:shikimate dehydrogenase family protein [Fulvivirga ligni]|uniref:shikimate dehydrogenase family protein n=1 Tax=Fulvivirga ligni TaxID=2904246 RepID=UPI001F2F70AD|nr:shikimate dehydrogenase [Fulvivirga ligni]UII23301.1 shikimate dehydrogenase [Fulvivirga ligni]